MFADDRERFLLDAGRPRPLPRSAPVHPLCACVSTLAFSCHLPAFSHMYPLPCCLQIAFRRCVFAVAPRVPAPSALHSHPRPFVADVQLRHSLYAFAVSTASPRAVAQCRLATYPSRLWCRSTDSYLTTQNYDFRCMLCCRPLLTALVALHLTTLPLPLDLQTTFRRVSARSARSARRWRTTCRSSPLCKKKGALPRPCVVVPFCASLC